MALYTLRTGSHPTRLPRLVVISLVVAAAAVVACGGDVPSSPLPAGTVAGAPVTSTAASAADDEQAVRNADRLLDEAIESRAVASLDALLDAEFTWIGTSGILRPRVSILAAPPIPAIAVGGDVAAAEVRRLGSHIVVAQRHADKRHAMRVWVRRSAGWRVLHVTEVTEGERVVYGGTMIGAADCMNPCKVVPFVPSNPVEKSVIEAWQAQQSGPEMWARHIPDDNVARTSNGTYTKADRIAVQLQQVKAGAIVAPSPLISAHIWEFGDSALMIALQPRAVGKPFWGSRVFELRSGTWVMAESYQTTIRDMPPF